MSICKSSLEKIGKAAYNSLSKDDQLKYTAASSIVSIITDVVKTGNVTGAVVDVGLKLTNVGLQLGSMALIELATRLTGKEIKTLSEAIASLSAYVKNEIEKLIDQTLHDLANKLAVLFGIDENPGIIGAIMEYTYRIFVKAAATV